MKIYHHNDLDGRCAAAIVWRVEGKITKQNIEIVELDYKDSVDVSRISSGETIIIVDFSFKPELMERVLKITDDIIWIDHHKTALEYKYSKELRGLRSIEYSGCELAWMYYNGEMPMPLAVTLIGDRDKWAWKHGKDTADFNIGLQIYDHNPKDGIWDTVFASEEQVKDIMYEGNICLKFRDSFCKDYRKSYGFETELEGIKAFALGIYMFGSEAFGERFKKYPLCLSFVYMGDKWTVGLYSETIDVSEIAKKYGGGGHKGAAGFVCEELPFKTLKKD